MVRVVRPPPPLLLAPPPLSSPPPQAATPIARAVVRQPAAATERTCKGPSSGTRYRRPGILCAPEDVAQWPECQAALTLNESGTRRVGVRRGLRSAGCPAGTARACAPSRRRGRSAP